MNRFPTPSRAIDSRAFPAAMFSSLPLPPDGWGFRCRPDGDAMGTERLSRAEMIEALTEIYGLQALQVN
ncbi:hypothetical protein I0J99_08335 [Sinorhizobium meliloti]|uniref:hypothetical protein n=1 Tax=Rhizobium meliloti TaxID=382 RepID=UPI0013E2EC31|nr:hypothetical protein [Sinorhizobium meliloti]QPI27231.1 hypothetical protein I0J99_08335 [Sinorhizobium meliloti]